MHAPQPDESMTRNVAPHRSCNHVSVVLPAGPDCSATADTTDRSFAADTKTWSESTRARSNSQSKDMTTRKHLPSFIISNASLISSNFMVCVTYFSSLVLPAWNLSTSLGTSTRLL